MLTPEARAHLPPRHRRRCTGSGRPRAPANFPAGVNLLRRCRRSLWKRRLLQWRRRGGDFSREIERMDREREVGETGRRDAGLVFFYLEGCEGRWNQVARVLFFYYCLRSCEGEGGDRGQTITPFDSSLIVEIVVHGLAVKYVHGPCSNLELNNNLMDLFSFCS